MLENQLRCCTPQQSCCGISQKEHVIIDFLFLDNSVCQRCSMTDQNIEQACDMVKPILDLFGIEIKLNKIQIVNESVAKKHHFLSSPTIRVNKVDIELDVKEDHCASCSDLCVQDIDCRVFTYNNKDYQQPPVAMLVERILKHVLFKQPHQINKADSFVISQNLQHFFNQKK